MLERELKNRRNCLFFDQEQNKQSVLHREYPTFNRLLKYKHVLKDKNELYVPQREIKENKEWKEKLKKQDRGAFDIVIWDPDQSWQLNELSDKSSYQNPKKCYFKEANDKFKRKSYPWESYFLSDESYFLDKLMNISDGGNLRIETNFTLSEQIKSSGTKTERKNRAFADEIVKKIQIIWRDSLENNPQKKINVAITVSTTKHRGI